jgi:glycosyltransferase involved in cell wall biosynthesis
MKIAFISFIKDPWGGSEVLWAEAAREALAQGHEVVISALRVAEPSKPLQALESKGAKILLRRGFINPAWNRRTRILHKIRIAILDLISNPFSAVVREQPDVVVFTGACYAMTLNRALFKLVRKHHIPLILNNQVNIEYTRPIDWEQAAYLREVYAYVSLATFVSQRNLDVTERHLAQRIPRSAVVRNPVNLPAAEALPMPAADPVYRFAIVANLLVNHKGHDLLLEVLSADKWKQRPVELHIFGSGSDEGYIRSLIPFFGLDGKVFMQGRTGDIRSVWERHHLLVMPSLNEGMALSVVEAMVCGRVVVTTDVGGNAEWITDGVEGFLAGGANTLAVDAALEAAWQRRDEWAEIGRRAHLRAMELHDPKPGHSFLQLILSHGRRP